MKTTNAKPAPPLSDVLHAFALAYTTPSADLLNEYIRLYPEHSAELRSLAVALALENWDRNNAEEEVQKTQEILQSTAVLKMISQFQNRLHDVRSNNPSFPSMESNDPAPENPFISLSRAEIKAFSGALNANSVFFMKLRDCQISLETMSEGFIARVAELLNWSAPGLRAFFTGGVKLSYSADYKAEKKPKAGARESFQEAVSNSNLSTDQQEYLLRL